MRHGAPSRGFFTAFGVAALVAGLITLANWKSNESVRWANAAEHRICAEYR
jgi:biotin transporter BioY